MFRPHSGIPQGNHSVKFYTIFNSIWSKAALNEAETCRHQILWQINFNTHTYSFTVPSSNHWEKCLLHKPIGSPEKSVGNYHYSLCNDPEERSSHLLRVRKLDSRFKGADILKIPVSYNYLGSRDISVEIASRYGLKGPGIESRWGEIFRTYPDWLRGPPSLL